MASSYDSRSSAIALLRRVRAGDHVHFVHHVDVCDAVPELLVADLEPVPGTGVEDDGYSRAWYFYCAKKFTNTRGELSGHRQRKVTGGCGASWHSEISRKEVQGSGGGTFCTFSYGLKTDPSARSIDRLGWCMVEYDFVVADKKQEGAATDSSNYVLCKVYRSPRAKEKPASASSSSKNASSKQTAKKRKAGGGDHPASSKQTAKKRKAGGGDHPEAPPAKLIQQQEPQVHQETGCYQAQLVEWEHGGDFNFNIEDINFYVDDDESMLRDEPEQGLQQPIAAPEHDGQFIQLPCGPVSAAEACTVELQQPTVEPPVGHGSEFIKMPFGPVVPVVAESILEDMLGLGPEMMYGEWSGGMATPWNSYAPTTLYTGCNSLPQGSDPLKLPYPTC